MTNYGRKFYIRRCENLDCAIPFYQPKEKENRRCPQCRDIRRQELSNKSKNV